jgi:ribosome biogenesis GTPase
MEYQQIPAAVCFNKCDLIEEDWRQRLEDTYAKSGHLVLFTSTKTGEGQEELKALLEGKTTTVAGPSGVGKSSLINSLQSQVQMETGDISTKIERGRHTTRHSQLIYIQQGTYIVDTPGFSTLYVEQIASEELAGYFAEFAPYAGECRFLGCSHSHEPGCGVKAALERGEIAKSRYENYLQLYNELKETKRY